MNSKPYLLISQDDYFKIRRKRKYTDKMAFIQSVVKYLERHSITYKERGDLLYIYPSDLFHAREICKYLGITEGHYFENDKPITLLNTLETDEDDDEIEKYTNSLAVLRNSLDNQGKQTIQTTLQEIMLFPFYWAVNLVIDDLIQEVYFGTSSNSEYTRIEVSRDCEYRDYYPKNAGYLWEFDLKNGGQLIMIDIIEWDNVSSPVVYSIDIYNSKNECVSYTLTLKDAFTQGSIVDLLFVPKKGRLVELVRES